MEDINIDFLFKKSNQEMNDSLKENPAKKESKAGEAAQKDAIVNHQKNLPSEEEKASAELSMSVSSICEKNGMKVAYVTFTDGVRMAEGEIPACKILSNKGFDEGELEQLRLYMKKELPTLKSMAAKINVFDAFLGRKQ